MVKKFIITLLLVLLFPYIITLAWTGRVEGERETLKLISGKKIFLDRDNAGGYVDVEEYLPGVVAKQVPADYGNEVLRAQAIIARTYIYKQMGDSDTINESALDLDYLEEKQMETLWGSDYFVEYYGRMEAAVGSTGKMVITSDGTLIDPLFHRASTGKTRNGDENHPYIQTVDSVRDVEAEGFLNAVAFSMEEFAEKINGIPGAAAVTVSQLPSTIQLIEMDDGGYVNKMQIGSKTYTGEEIQYALGLPSASFTLEEYSGKIRAVSKGIGHGYGFSQYGAKVKAEEGWTAEDLLSFFYKNIVIISE